MKASHVLLALFILVSTTYSYNESKDRIQPTITDLPNSQLMVHREPNINLSVTNFGVLGSQEGEIGDIEGYFDPAPGAMYPAYSNIEYLFEGGIWIGAEIDTVDQNGNPVIDTVVSAGIDGWWGDVMELWPEEGSGGAMWRDQTIADEEIYAVYYDTSTWVPPDPNDQRPHIPMGLKITQHSFAWSSPGYNNFIIIDYVLENIGSRYLHNAYFGVYWDGDVYHYETNPFYGFIDDICGYTVYDNRWIAWLADNDGDPNQTNDPGFFDYRSPANILGLTLLNSTTPGLETNFNWWISNVVSAYDWGPQRVENYTGPFPCGGKGTPCGDKAKYKVMSNGEHDYGTVWCDLVNWENNGWISRPPHSTTIADGYDTKYLISFGPFDLPAGQAESLSVVLLGGEGFHNDPLNFDSHLLDRTFDSSSIALYYDNLNFDGMYDMLDTVLAAYQLGFINIPPGPPPDFRITGWGGDFVELKWTNFDRWNLMEYRIYRGTEQGVYVPQKLTPDGFIDSVFVDSTVRDNVEFYYVITSANIFDVEGGYSPEASINTGQPQTPTGLSAVGGNSRIEISWNHNPDSDILGYLIYKSEGPDNFTMLTDTVGTNHYTDTYVGNGLEFFYYITAIDSFMNVSNSSDTVSAIPMGFDSGILLVTCNIPDPQINPDFDSMMVFYENILGNYLHQTISYTPQSLPEVAYYSTLIYAKELPAGFQRFFLGRDMLETYLALGGNIVLAGTRQLTGNAGAEGVYTFNPNDIQSQYFNLDGIEFSAVFENTEFTGGSSTALPFNDFVLDSSRIDRIIYPPNLPSGRLNGVGVLIPNDTSEVIYSYISAIPDTSNFHGRPIGIFHQTDTYKTAVLEFPLYYVEEPISYQILHRILDDVGEVPITSANGDQVLLPYSTKILQNHPNPFNNSTTLRYNLTRAGIVSIAIYNILGQQVAGLVDEYQQPGAKSVNWAANDLPSGIYFAKMKTGDYSGSIKLLLLK